MNNKLDQKKTIELYTKQSFLYSMINSLLRVGKHPCDIIFLQPYIS